MSFRIYRKSMPLFKKTITCPECLLRRTLNNRAGLLVNRATEINLEKIEELFLHAIEQEEQIQTLQREKEMLAREVSELKLRLDRIEKAITEKPKRTKYANATLSGLVFLSALWVLHNPPYNITVACNCTKGHR